MANRNPKFAHLKPRQKLFPGDSVKISLRVSTEDREFLIAWAPPSVWMGGSRPGAALRQCVDVARGILAPARLHHSGVTKEPRHVDAKTHVVGMVVTAKQREFLLSAGDGDLTAGAREVVNRIRAIIEQRP